MHKTLRRLAWFLIALLLTALYAHAMAFSVSVTYPASGEELVNPYIGNAVWAGDKPEHDQPFTLVYANLVWADFEPEQGRYDFAAFEKENQFALWRARDKHLILRFVMDVPTTKKHRDIPDWLYRAMDQDGTAYSVSYGRGFSPNYENPVLIEAHARAVAALGERYGDDPFVAYIEIGSLGHWGEWHVHEKIGSMPPEAVRDQYVMPYIEAFPNAFLLMRRPFAIAADYGMGLFNDTAGEPKSTGKWLEWIQDGGDYETPDGRNALVPMPDAWQTAPVGGELSTALPREDLLSEYSEQTLSLFAQSHTSWIGPGSFADVERGGEYQAALDEILRTVGYRIRVAQCDVRQAGDGQIAVTLYWANDGIAPFYFDWQPTLAIAQANGSEVLLPLDLRLTDLLPGQTVRTEVALPATADSSETYTLWIGIVDPAANTAGVALAMQAEQKDLWYKLVQFSAR